MMSVTQESVKSAFCLRIPGVCWSRGNFFFVKLPFLVTILSKFLFYFYIFVIAKCLQLDSNVITNNLREKNGFETFFPFHTNFYL